MTETPRRIIAVLGPTASGKTSVGCRLAHALGGEILSADSRQVYRGLDIGSGKDLDAYTVDGEPIPYHLIDIAEVGEEYNVFRYQCDFHRAVGETTGRERIPIVVGGTGLYLEAALRETLMVEAPKNMALRAELKDADAAHLEARLVELGVGLHNTTDLHDRERTLRAIEIAEHARLHPPAPAPPLRAYLIGLSWPREELHRRIETRLRERLANGLVEEVEGLVARGVPESRLEALGLEYRFVTDYLSGRIKNRNDLYQKLAVAIKKFAKRQGTWFRRMERHGHPIQWIDGADAESAQAYAKSFLEGDENA